MKNTLPVTCCIMLLFLSLSSAANTRSTSQPDVKKHHMLQAYERFLATQAQQANPYLVPVRLSYIKGLSSTYSRSSAIVRLDFKAGTLSLELDNQDMDTDLALWILDNDDSLPVDNLIHANYSKVAEFKKGQKKITLKQTLDIKSIKALQLDWLVITDNAKTLSRAKRYLYGSLSTFQKVFLNNKPLTIGTRQVSVPSRFANRTLKLETLIPQMPMDSAQTINFDNRLEQGSRLFLEHTFGGNGRTCGSCHPLNNNFTIDKPFIDSLPDNDPLFVAEFNPALAELEQPLLMREFGLIVENLDGLEDPTRKFVMRSVPHILSINTGLTQDPNLVNPPAEMTGWSGDGAPGSGSLREFAIGAVIQHFPRSLNRNSGPDFTLPNNLQLDAMDLFQRSVGRLEDPDLASLSFVDSNMEAGKNTFLNGNGAPNAGGTCNACHNNGGATFLSTGINRNFNTGVEDVPHPARLLQDFPRDGGFGKDFDANTQSFGDQSFNSFPVIEAADTGPFFHNNIVATIEEAIAFYNSAEFNGPRPPFLRINLSALEVSQMGDFLRGINAVQNIDLAIRMLDEIINGIPGNARKLTDARLIQSGADTDDAIDVLTEKSLLPGVVTVLGNAFNLIAQAQQTPNPNRRKRIIGDAIAALEQAKNGLLN